MSNQTPPDESNPGSDEEPGSSLATVADIVGDLVTGSTIPAPVRRNAIKAFTQLCTAAIEIPVAYLEGIAAEKRAETQARVKIISTGADQIAAQMQVDPEFARVAVMKFGQKIVRERVNLDKVSEAAARDLQSPHLAVENSVDATQDAPPIDDDWLNNFEKEACEKSTEEMQLLFGRILAGEIRRPNSFSIKTVKLMGQLDSRAAMLFRKLCSLCISLRIQDDIFDARVVSLGGNAASNSLQQYGLNFGQLNVLNEYGLIISDYNSYMDYRLCISTNSQASLPLTYQNGTWVLVLSEGSPASEGLQLHGVALSRSGAELLRVVDLEPDDRYTDALKAFFSEKKLSMTKLADS